MTICCCCGFDGPAYVKGATCVMQRQVLDELQGNGQASMLQSSGETDSCVPTQQQVDKRTVVTTADSSTAANKASGNVLSDQYLMSSYKVVACRRKYAHDWASCPCAHNGERAARRDLSIYPYMAIACQYAKQRLPCPMGDRCPHAHNLFEYWLHPQRFKTELCQFGANCDRPVCFFGHVASELRRLDPSLPPAEACWSAGAALHNRGNRYQRQQPQMHQQQQLMGMQPAGIVGGYQQLQASPVLNAPANNMIVQQQGQQQVVIVAPAQVYGAPGVPPAMPPGVQQYPQQPQQQYQYQPQQQQQQVVLLQQGPSTGGSAAAGYGAMPMQNTAMPVMEMQAQQQPQTPGMQMQQVQYSTPTSNQPTYVYLQVSDNTAGNSGAYVSPQGTMQVAGMPATVGPIMQPPQGMMLGGYMPQQQQQALPAQAAYAQSPHMQTPVAGGFVQSSSLSPVAAAPPGIPELQQQQPSTGGSWQYGLYPTSSTVQAQTVDGVLVDLQNMQLAPGM